MAKQSNKNSMAEDYLARIKWEGQHPYMGDGSKPAVPKWKYNPIGSKRRVPSRSARVIAVTMALIVLGGLLYLALFKHESGATIILGILAFIGVFLFFLNLDVSRPNRRK